VITVQELKQKMMQLDEVTLMELLEVTSEDLVNRFGDIIENNYDYFSGEFDEDTPWDND
jgi:hypothetical protein